MNASDADSPRVTEDFARAHLSSIETSSARADLAILVLAAIAIGMIGYLASNHPDIEGPDITRVAGLVLAAFFLGLQLTALSRAAFPNHKRTGASLLDFRSIATRTAQQFTSEYLAADDGGRLDQMARQIHHRASILAVKHEEMRKAFISLIIAVPAWALALGIIG
jgi:hypothetical protein